ncbi:SDR family NAD(P)-dependent oxidoreductase [Leifsonia sp. H3M29-4]|uniref:SDR family NAD(P)-dependent oxidoreductase n=1 Tax=Salinibacterium metalliresistens TaxID=3031321 RepID=UPI0023DB6840|nr:SDR family NAD(P)-dependent oxidoreductase [Salinibacterium metalliresistens]MDF1480007.1 SDR family NAD(P)-dependent oxidoreductase [Salinibacterium metalliresistens]
MSGRFEGKVALVTGAASGLGRASAQRLSSEGASVVLIDLDGDKARDAAAELAGETLVVQADVSDESAIDAAVASAVERFGRVDHHHLNAGIFGSFVPLPDLSVQEFERVMAVNVRGAFLGTRAAFRQFSAQGTPGSIVVTASIASLTGAADLLAYHTSKHAVVGLVHAAAVYGGPLGIRVNAVAPGIVPTELFAAAATASGGKNDMEHRASTTPMRRAGTTEEIAGVAAFLLSDDAGYVTGQIVSADGGATIVNTVRPSGGAGAWDTRAVDDPMYRGSGNWSTQQ